MTAKLTFLALVQLVDTGEPGWISSLPEPGTIILLLAGLLLLLFIRRRRHHHDEKR